MGPPSATAEPPSPAEELSRLYRSDLAERDPHPSPGTEAYRLLRQRDAARRSRAESLLEQHPDLPARALYHAAWLLNHGDTVHEARRAHELALEAAKRGVSRARWLAAAAFDRWRMVRGEPQRYGTQFVPDGVRYRLWDTDPATTDAERREWDVPNLKKQLRRADEMTRDEAQPPMDEAPEWLRRAIERWELEDQGSSSPGYEPCARTLLDGSGAGTGSAR